MLAAWWDATAQADLKTTGAEWEGWNLVGNPFNQTAYISDARPFYTMNDDGSEIMAAETNTIAAMEGVFEILLNACRMRRDNEQALH